MEHTKNQENRALLIMDVQGATVKMLPDSLAITQSITRVIQAARKANIPVIYVVLGFRKGYPEISPNNKSFVMLKNGPLPFDTEESAKIYEPISPLPGDTIITKKRTSAFAGSDLEVLLRSFGINHLVLAGIATSGVVLSTTREAADKDYRLTILSDCCADRDEEVHRVLTTKVFPRQADVVTAEEWATSI